MKILITIYHADKITTQTTDVADRTTLSSSVAAQVAEFLGKETVSQHPFKIIHYQLETPDGSMIDSGTPKKQADLGIPEIPEIGSVLKITLVITPKKLRKADAVPKDTLEMIRTAISELLEADTGESTRTKAKKCIKKAAKDGTIVPHLPALCEYLQKHVKDGKKPNPAVNEIRSWLNEATPRVELSTGNKELLIQELKKGKPNIEFIKKTLHGVTSLSLEQCDIRDQGVQTLAEVLKSNTALISLNLEGNQIGGPGATDLAEALKSNTTLTSLNLKKNEIGDPGVTDLAEALKSNATLTSLNLEGNEIRDPGVTNLAEALKSNTTLTSLDLGYNEIESPGAAALAEALKSNATLTSLELEYNNIGYPGAKDLAEALKSNVTLTSLNLKRNHRIGDPGAIALAEALKSNATLTSLNLEVNFIGDQGAIALAEALKSNATLTSLNLERSTLIRDSGATALAEALKSNTTLTSLNLYWNQIGDPGAKDLTEALKSNATLTSLNLKKNKIGDPGAKDLAKVLKNNATLISLNLENNDIGDPGAKDLAEALKSNFSLTSLSLTPSSSDINKATDFYLQRNKTRLAKATEYLTTSFVEEVAKEIKLITPLTKIIGDYLTPHDLISECDIVGSAAGMSQFGLHASRKPKCKTPCSDFEEQCYLDLTNS